MYAEFAFTNNISYLLNPNLAAILNFLRTTRQVAAIKHGKNFSEKKRAVLGVKWAINKDTCRIVCLHLASALFIRFLRLN
ncbi:hypothetical protein LA76x_1301 [Lysobacter antibioticus]|uniref:Uncharacterized protein n=1 Tax=Lysobacter antibioticus TaxID=84531 RepID=A0A0S2F7L0_LYSAN|nr:hypothetical protein LA76x_1301 [Lysobacter antibioticus]